MTSSSTIAGDKGAVPASGTPLTDYLLLGLQLALAVLVVYAYRIENEAFLRVFVLGAAGAAIHVALPLRLRLPFFVLLSLTGAFVVFGVADALWLLGTGLVLIGLCHLPWSLMVRGILIAVVGAVMALSRGGWLPHPWSGAVWPILGSMFMFRLVLYLMSMKPGKQQGGGAWWPLAYFFMLPNLVFPLFPVVDYQTLRRTHYEGTPAGIYQQGMLWIARGLVHLLAYRFVYLNVLNDPNDIVRLSDLVQSMLGTFLLYLRVSGQFHLIVGMLHLFGFKLPETHKMYYLAHSFTELWRRINIYWTDFMMKTVFYPTYFKVKNLGPKSALVLSTVAVFVTTWLLHSYQWFWLRGGFPMTVQDTLFWGLLGAFVVRGALNESTVVKKTLKRAAGWDWKTGLHAAVTFGCFCFLWSLWSTQSVSQWVWSLGAVANVDAKGVAMLLGALGVIFVAGGFVGTPKTVDVPRWQALMLSPVTRSLVPLVVLALLNWPAVHAAVPASMVAGLDSLKETRLNASDSALQHRGYYEQLDVRAQLNAPVLAAATKGDTWVELSQLNVIHDRPDIMIRDLYPSRQVTWNGNAFSTNRWGMRDKDYPREKPADTYRIAILGPSHVMGNGVADGETFESLVEDRLNREFTTGRYRHFEILNFAVDGYSLLQQLALLEDRVFDFSPDAIIVTHYVSNRAMTESCILKVVWNDYQVPYEPLQELMSSAGLDGANDGDLSIPFSPARSMARAFGLRPRMPFGESAARVRWIADDAIDMSFRRIDRVARAKGVRVAVLGLNVVMDGVSPRLPNEAVIRELNLPTFNLFGVYPEAQRPALRVAPWDDHPNATGHRLIADALYRPLVGFLESSAGDAPVNTARTN